MPRLTAERRRQEQLHEPKRIDLAGHPRAERHDVRVIVLSSQPRRVVTVGEGAADTGHLVGRDGLAVAATAEDNAEAAGIAHGARGSKQDVRRVVVLRVVHVRTTVHDVVPERADVLDESLLQRKAGMVGAEVDAHSGSIAHVLVRGVDGCRGGWLAVDVDDDDLAASAVTWRWSPLDETEALLHDRAVEAVAIDVPIGLPESGSRACDVAARKLLGRRGVSVFPAPVRAVLGCGSYADARAILAALGAASMSAQAFGIVSAVAAVDASLTGADTARVFECHPEVAFYLMGGSAGLPGKRTPEGVAARLRLLGAAHREVSGIVESRPRRIPVDDALDALACAWSAARWVRGQAAVLGDGEKDVRGLPMRIVA
jgi:predicted RNase H-like nuclease